MDFAGAGLLDGLEGDEREARWSCSSGWRADGFSARAAAPARWPRTGSRCCRVDRVLGGGYTAAEDRGARPGCPPSMRDPDPAPAGAARGRARRPRVLPTRTSRPPARPKLFLDAGFDEERDRRDHAGARRGHGAAGGDRHRARSPAPSCGRATARTRSRERFAELAEQLTPALTPVLVAAFKDHLRDSVSRGVLGRGELEAGRLPGAVRSSRLLRRSGRLHAPRRRGRAERARRPSPAGWRGSPPRSPQAPVRLIKTIGDAAMFVSPEPGPLVDVALALVEAVEDAELPSLRAGIAVGPALLRAGDYYGNSVNLASRVTGVARPGACSAPRSPRRGRRRRFALVVAGPPPPQGRREPRAAVPRARRPDGRGIARGRARRRPSLAPDRRAGRSRRRASS